VGLDEMLDQGIQKAPDIFVWFGNWTHEHRPPFDPFDVMIVTWPIQEFLIGHLSGAGFRGGRAWLSLNFVGHFESLLTYADISIAGHQIFKSIKPKGPQGKPKGNAEV
jgi:hypothetical protein